MTAQEARIAFIEAGMKPHDAHRLPRSWLPWRRYSGPAYDWRAHLDARYRETVVLAVAELGELRRSANAELAKLREVLR